ncbi:MAG: hypothetical protein GEV09_11240 [Pseudonocardiaceae bacterium]|nr:hypothetical protein [Pseudonocardiaceae bacterium]
MSSHRRSGHRSGVDELLARELAAHYDTTARDKTDRPPTPAEREQALAWARGVIRAARRLGLPLRTPQPQGRPTMTTAPTTTGWTAPRAGIDARSWEPEHRATVVSGLRALADLLDTHPDLRCPYQVRISASTIGDSATAERAEVDAAAALLGVRPHNGQTYIAERYLNDAVAFAVVHLPARFQCSYQAALSYQDNLAPGEQGA